jgi:hypothetical protein
MIWIIITILMTMEIDQRRTMLDGFGEIGRGPRNRIPYSYCTCVSTHPLVMLICTVQQEMAQIQQRS